MAGSHRSIARRSSTRGDWLEPASSTAAAQPDFTRKPMAARTSCASSGIAAVPIDFCHASPRASFGAARRFSRELVTLARCASKGVRSHHPLPRFRFRLVTQNPIAGVLACAAGWYAAGVSLLVNDSSPDACPFLRFENALLPQEIGQDFVESFGLLQEQKMPHPIHDAVIDLRGKFADVGFIVGRPETRLRHDRLQGHGDGIV